MEMTKRLVVLMLGLLAGCSDTLHGKEYAEPVVARFRAQMKAHHFDRIYDSASARFKEATPRDKGIALFAAVDRKLGAFKSAEQVNWSVNTNNGVTTVVLAYATKYADSDATEVFTILVEDQKAELIGYNIQSLDMLIR